MKSFVTLVFPALLALVGPSALSATQDAAKTSQDSLRHPYIAGSIYKIQVTAGNPFMLELPSGERAKNIYFDNKYWDAESTPETERVAIRALRATDIVGTVGSIQIETEPSGLLITVRAEVMEERSPVPLTMSIYLDGGALQGSGDVIKTQVDRRVSKELLYVNRASEERTKAEFSAWKRQALENLRDSYSWGGDFKIDRVVDDKVQTYIYCASASDKAVLEMIDKGGKQEKVNYELENGCYVVQNKVLRSGEKFRLLLGKEKAWIALK